jgi:hypothetical protein
VRLYGLFRRVMGDYAAVFSRPSPSYRPLPLSSTQGSNALIYGGTPVTLHYRVVASSRPEVSHTTRGEAGHAFMWTVVKLS